MDDEDYDDMFVDEAIEVRESLDGEDLDGEFVKPLEVWIKKKTKTPFSGTDHNKLVVDSEKTQLNIVKPAVSKRETKPRLKYSEYDLIGPKGLVALKRTFEDYKLPTNGKAPVSPTQTISLPLKYIL